MKTAFAPFRIVTLAGFIAALVLAFLVLLPVGSGEVEGQAPAEPRFKVLVFSKTTGFRHDSIPAGVAAIRELGAQNGFAVDATEAAGAFTDANLEQYEAVVFLNTDGNNLLTGARQGRDHQPRQGRHKALHRRQAAHDLLLRQGGR